MKNIAWGSTNKSKLLSLYRKPKQAARKIFCKDKLTSAKPLLTEINALTNEKIVPDTFETLFSQNKNKYILKIH